MVPSETWEQNAFSVWPPLIAGPSGVQKLNTSEYVECPDEEGSNQELDGMLSVSCLFLSRCWHRWSSRPRNTQCEQCLAKYTVPLWAHTHNTRPPAPDTTTTALGGTESTYPTVNIGGSRQADATSLDPVSNLYSSTTRWNCTQLQSLRSEIKMPRLIVMTFRIYRCLVQRPHYVNYARIYLVHLRFKMVVIRFKTVAVVRIRILITLMDTKKYKAKVIISV